MFFDVPTEVSGGNVISVLIPELHHCCVIDLLLLEPAPIAPQPVPPSILSSQMKSAIYL